MKKKHFGYLAAVACSMAFLTSKALAISLPVDDALFDSQSLPATSAPPDGRGTWGLAAWGGGEVGTYSPSSPYPGQDGDNVGSLSVGGAQSGGSAFYQDATLIREGTYSLTVGVAHERGAEPTTAPFRINFESAGFGSPTSLLGENDFAVESFNNSDLTNVTATVTISNGSPAIGQYLRPVLLLTGQDAGAKPTESRASYDLDHVQMDFTAPAGTPTPVVIGQHSFDPVAWNRPAGAGGNAGEYRPVEPVFANQTGEQLGFISVRDFEGSWGALFQDVTTINPGTYTMTIGVAHEPGFEPTSAPLSLNFEAAGGNLPTVLLGENTFAVGAANSSSFTDLSVSVTIPTESPDIGRDLRLVMVTAGQEAGTGSLDHRATYLFDNVRLEFTPVPEPTTAGLAFIAMGAVTYRRLRTSFSRR